MAWEPNVIVAAVDGSERSIEATQLAAEMARRNGSKLHILTVVRPPEGWWGIGGAPPPARALSESLVEAQKEVLDRTVQQVNLEGVEYQVNEELGDPAGAIVHYCDDVDADLLVIGRRGAGLIERFVMGSVADRLVHYSPCPVVVVP